MNIFEGKKSMVFKQGSHSSQSLLDLYKAIILPRLIEKKMLSLLRQGKISKWFSGWGQEGISVGVAKALEKEDTILTMHRNLGVFTSRGIELKKLFAQFLGKQEGFTKGRDRSFHFGSKEHNIIGMISHLGAQMGVADGVALANQLREEKSIVAVFSGDGGASEGDFHEAINVAAVWKLPVMFIVENNAWGLSTPSREQFACKSFKDKGIGYGIQAISIDGNNILEVQDEIRKAATQIRYGGGPILIEARTFRLRGHEEASGTKYYPDGLIDQWEEKDPVDQFEHFLIKKGILTPELVTQLKEETAATIMDHWREAVALPEQWESDELADVYAPWKMEVTAPKEEGKTLRLIDAIREGMEEGLKKYDNLILMGQDIADYGGVFKATEGFVDTFGKDRIRNTPLCESAILGAALGLSYKGMKSMVEMQFADFVTCGFNQITNNLAKSHYRWGQNADVVVRMPTGAGTAAGPFHSQSNEAWFLKTPGLHVYYPSNPYDAKGLLLAAFENPNPVLYFEHKKMYRSTEDYVPSGYYTIEPGKARITAVGEKVSIITYGMGVHWALDQLKNFPENTLEIIDLRTLNPLDTETIYASVIKTGKALVLQEDTTTMGIASEISSLIMENCFPYLDGPVKRLGSLDSPIPFNATLEGQFLPQQILQQNLEDLINF